MDDWLDQPDGPGLWFTYQEGHEELDVSKLQEEDGRLIEHLIYDHILYADSDFRGCRWRRVDLPPLPKKRD